MIKIDYTRFLVDSCPNSVWEEFKEWRRRHENYVELAQCGAYITYLDDEDATYALLKWGHLIKVV